MTDNQLNALADAAFKVAAKDVIARAIASGTPVIVRVNGEVKALDPHQFRQTAIGKKTKKCVRKPAATKKRDRRAR